MNNSSRRLSADAFIEEAVLFEDRSFIAGQRKLIFYDFPLSVPTRSQNNASCRQVIGHADLLA